MIIYLKYFHPTYNISFTDLRSAWLLTPTPVALKVVVHQGMLTYRLPLTGKRVSYKQLKNGLLKKQTAVKLPGSELPF